MFRVRPTIGSMSDFLQSYLSVAIAGGLAIVMALGTLALGRFVRPRRRQQQKELAYESGADAAGPVDPRISVRFYLYALLFLVFDIEVAFIAPWALQVEEFGTFGLIEMLIFVGVLALGIVYAWRKQVFSWDS